MTANRIPSTCSVGSFYVLDSAASAVIQNDVAGGPTTIRELVVNNANNNSAIYFKVYDSLAPSVTLDVPVLKIKVAAKKSTTLYFSGLGLTLATGLSYICTSDSTETGSTAPAQAVAVQMLIG